MRTRGCTGVYCAVQVFSVYNQFVLYRCVASNNIGNKRREEQSEAITLDITGPPQITSTLSDVSGVMGREVEVRAEFCSDPGPIRVTWNWEQIKLPAGNEYGGKASKMSSSVATIELDMVFNSNSKVRTRLSPAISSQ